MLKRTPGKWKCGYEPNPDKPGHLKLRIYAEFEDTKETRDLRQAGPGDFQLMTNSPEMNNLNWEIRDILRDAIAQGVITQEIYKAERKLSALIETVNVERDKED